MKNEKTVHTQAITRNGRFFLMKFRKIEISLAVGLLCALVWCALEPGFLMSWWGAAFEPLCDGVLTAEGAGGEVVLRSFFAELLEKLLS